MIIKIPTDWLYRWNGECEARPSYHWHVDTDYRRNARLSVLFPFCFVAYVYCFLRNIVCSVEHKLYCASAKRYRPWYKAAWNHGYEVGKLTKD